MPSAAKPRKPPAARRAGYVVAVLVDLALLFAVNRWPGWESLPFLTADTTRVLPLVNASLWVGVVANLVFLLRDPPWLRALGDVVTTAVGLLAMVRIWQVFPVEFTSGGFDWEPVARLLLVVGIVGSVIGVAVALVNLARALLAPRRDQGAGGPGVSPTRPGRRSRRPGPP